MSVLHPHVVRCVCGETLVAQLAESVNGARSPALRERILRGALHRVSCPVCVRGMTVEKPFYYVDLERGALFQVHARGQRYQWRRASALLDAAAAAFPPWLPANHGLALRVVFGMDELREKLIAQDLELDDRVVELLKVLLLYEHPVLLRRARLRLTLDGATAEAYRFTAAYEHHPQRFRVWLPRAVADRLAADPDWFRRWADAAHGEGSVFRVPDDHWVNVWRWSLQPRALEQLCALASALRRGEPIDVASPEFDLMLDYLPSGDHLPPWAKRDLHLVSRAVRSAGSGPVLDRLFERRFGFLLEDDWHRLRQPKDIGTVWDLLEALPDSEVEGNTHIDEIQLGLGSASTYDPDTRDIVIAASELDKDAEKFARTLRHEVGHAVHEQRRCWIDPWLEKEFGWLAFDPDDDGIDAWVGMLGGWSSLSPEERADVRRFLKGVLGEGGNFAESPTTELAEGHPGRGEQFAPWLAYQNTGTDWFKRFDGWHRVGDRAFCLNYYYCKLTSVYRSTLELVAGMPDAYASMSASEFFAELYALYRDPHAPGHTAIPPSVRAWLDAHLGPDAPPCP